jgi:hypothetical protein
MPQNKPAALFATGSPDPRRLLDLPFTFAHLHALTTSEFIKEAKERGVAIDEEALEALHRRGLLVPFFRRRKQNRLIQGLVRRGDPDGEHLAAQSFSARWSLELARDQGRLYDAATEPVRSRAARTATAGRRDYLTSEYLYGHFQLLMLPTIQQGLPYLRDKHTSRPRLGVNRLWLDWALHRASAMRDIALVLTALEPLYYSRIIGTLRLPSVEDFTRHDRWRAKVGLTSTMRWLGIRAVWLREGAAGLLMQADGIDPLGDWLEVVRRGSPERWRRLKGLARCAMDLRIGAELMLRYYDELAVAGKAKSIEPNRSRLRDEFHGRLASTDDKDRVLTDFGLSPHPRLILVVEGATERLIFPRLMEHLGVTTSREFIAIEDAEGVDTDLGPLIAYAIAPQIEPPADTIEPTYVQPTRPLTRVLFAADPERSMQTAKQREARRRVWVERIERALPSELRTPAMLESVDRLVYVDTWSQSGLGFEFAHFGDREIAGAMDRIDQSLRAPSLSRRVQLVRDCRKRRGNLDELFRGSKVDLADELWPLLQAKVDRAEALGRINRIPVVRVLDRAVRLAVELRGGNVVLEL